MSFNDDLFDTNTLISKDTIMKSFNPYQTHELTTLTGLTLYTSLKSSVFSNKISSYPHQRSNTNSLL